jgi:hypothetical protein
MNDNIGFDAGPHAAKSNTPPPPKPPTRQEVIDWLAYQTEALVLRRDREVLPAIAKMVAAHPTIADGDEDLAGRFAENIQMARDLIKDADRAHTEHKAPYLAAGRAVDGWKNTYEAVVEHGLESIETIARDYALRKYNRQKAEREAEAARAAEAARVAKEAADKAIKRDMWSDDAMAKGQEATRKASAANQTARRASASPTLSTRGDYGAKAGMVRKWKCRLVDITKVPAEYLMLNEPALQVAGKPRDPITNKPTAEIAGIEWYEDLSFAVRA